ncbi:MAG: serine hydrolase domain-containing protein [Thermoleophilia bacterium]|jgi:D-alanyl-D-alanine carboxypeptidase
MKKHILLAVVLVLIPSIIAATFFITSCGNEGNNKADTSTQQTGPPFDPEIEKKLEKVVDENMKSGNIPGVIVGIWAPGRGTWVSARGFADISTGVELQPVDKVRIASNTKTFTATVILQLADEGKLSLSDSLSKYVAGIPNGEKITIRQLLNMTAGIYNFTADPEFEDRFEKNPLMKFTHNDMMQIVLRHKPDFDPGQGWNYSDTNYELLGMIVEKVTNNRLEPEIDKRVIKRLGLVHTSYPVTPDMVGDYSRGYYLPAGATQLKDFTLVDPSVAWAGGAMVSNLYDMQVYGGALARGELVSQKMQKERLAWTPMPGQEKWDGKYGLGIASIGGYIGHTGAIFGYNSIVFYLPEKDATFIVFTNKSGNDSSEAVNIFLQTAKIVFPETLAAQPVPN